MRARSIIFGLALSAVAIAPALSAPCSRDDLARAVDQSGAKLRAFSLEAQPPLRQRIRRYAEATKTPAENEEDAALDAIQDKTLRDLDERSSELLLRVDGLGRVDEKSEPDCSRLKDIETASGELLTVMRTKSDYMLARLDLKISEAGGRPATSPSPSAATSTAPPTAPPPVTPNIIAKAPEPEPTPTPKPPAAAKSPEKKQPAVPPAKPEPPPEREKPNDAYVPPPTAALSPPPSAPQADPSAPPLATADAGYSIDEIRDATRGFFGTVSTNLASVIEYAFKTSGRPTGYVLGTEGGGAFFAGLRIGSGRLFMRDRPEVRDIHWHGPSLGTDFGASGSRTMFLIYKLRDPGDIYRIFTGVDGSAYVIGGVGVTLLKGGDVIMAPIRSGLGFRLGANIGYVRFTDRATWNPF